jgi:mannosyltransferase OCH1-like enzyme
MFWTDDMILKLISEEYPNFYNIYKLARAGVQKGDIARILLVYHYGGIYIDLDVLVLRDFNEIVDKILLKNVKKKKPLEGNALLDFTMKEIYFRKNAILKIYKPLYKQFLDETIKLGS